MFKTYKTFDKAIFIHTGVDTIYVYGIEKFELLAKWSSRPPLLITLHHV